MMIVRGEWVIDFGGYVIIEGNGITDTNQTTCDFRLALTEAMTFSDADGMLKIGSAGSLCNLYETKTTALLAWSNQPHFEERRNAYVECEMPGVPVESLIYEDRDRGLVIARI
jgi:hypothetical protein